MTECQHGGKCVSQTQYMDLEKKLDQTTASKKRMQTLAGELLARAELAEAKARRLLSIHDEHCDVRDPIIKDKPCSCLVRREVYNDVLSALKTMRMGMKCAVSTDSFSFEEDLQTLDTVVERAERLAGVQRNVKE